MEHERDQLYSISKAVADQIFFETLFFMDRGRHLSGSQLIGPPRCAHVSPADLPRAVPPPSPRASPSPSSTASAASTRSAARPRRWVHPLSSYSLQESHPPEGFLKDLYSEYSPRLPTLLWKHKKDVQCLLHAHVVGSGD